MIPENSSKFAGACYLSIKNLEKDDDHKYWISTLIGILLIYKKYNICYQIAYVFYFISATHFIEISLQNRACTAYIPIKEKKCSLEL